MFEQNVRQTIGALRFGAPMRDGSLCILPLRTTAGVDARYVLLGQAISRGTMVITEVTEAGSVPYLQAVNKGPWPVLIFDGEELVGAKQNRIANATILVGVGKTILPVSCVEQGRWSHRSQSFGAGAYVSHAGLRRAKERQVRMAMTAQPQRDRYVPRERSYDEAAGPGRASAQADAEAQAVRAARFRSDQGRVWEEVARSSRSLGVDSPTMAMADTYEAGRDELERILRHLALEKPGAADEVVGVVVFVSGRFVCLDLLQPAKRFALLYPKLLRGYALEAQLQGTGEPQDFDPEAHTLRLFAEMLEASVEDQPGVDLGSDLRLESKEVSGSGLVWEEKVVQLSVFPKRAE